MRAKLVTLQGALEAEGTPEELAEFFRRYSGWTLSGSLPSSGTLGPIQLTPAPISVPTPWFDVVYCAGGGQHEYPSPWLSVGPAPCKKCGASSAPVLPFISTFTVEGVPENFSLPVVTNTTTSGVGSA